MIDRPSSTPSSFEVEKPAAQSRLQSLISELFFLTRNVLEAEEDFDYRYLLAEKVREQAGLAGISEPLTHYLAWHLLIGSTPPDNCPYIDLEGEFNIEGLLREEIEKFKLQNSYKEM